MGGSKKKRLQSGRSSKSRYFSSPGSREKKTSSTHGCYGDHRLAPRIKEYLGDHGNHVPVDVSEMALALQAEYSEYARKKKVAFRNLVAKVYKSLKDCHAAETRLERLERERVRRRAMQKEEEEGEESGEGSLSDLSSDSDADFEAAMPEGYNMMNDSLLQVYNCQSDSLSNTSPFHDSSDLTNLPSKDVLLSSGSNGPVTSEENHNSPPPATYEENNPHTLPAGIIISQDLQTKTSSHGGDLEEAVEEKEVTVTAGEEVVRTPPAVNSIAPDVQEPQLLGDVHPKDPSSLSASASSPLLPFPSESEPPPLQQQQPSHVGKRVTFAPKVTEYSDNGRREKVERNLYQTRSPSSRVKLKRGAVEGETEDSRSMRQKSKRRKTKEGDQSSGRGAADASVKRTSLTQKHSTEFSVEKSDVRFSDIGGCESCLKEVCQLLLHLVHPEVFRTLGVRPHQGFLLHGPPGCGKTLLAHAIAGELNLPFIKLAATEVVSGVSGESEQTIRDLFQQAREHAPCVLFIDEIDAICPKRETAQREMERRIVTQLLACLDELNRGVLHEQVLVIGATSRPDTLDPALRRAGRFDREVSLGIPDEQARERILQVLCRGLKLEEGFMFSDIAHRTPGFVGADLMALTREASLLAINRVLREMNETEQMDEGSHPAEQGGGSHHSEAGGGEDPPNAVSTVQWMREQPSLTEEQLQKVFITSNDFSVALGLVQPSAKREGFATVPDTTWDDVGALESIREELSIAILAPVRYPRQFAELGLTSSPPGILLAGPPGCGKTLLAKAIANETGINFISVKGPELLNMYVGESERAVRQVFQRARNSAPCVIFFDELDALCPKRSETRETSASARVVNQLLTEMDGLETRKQVFIMAATNRPDIIDPAVMRPGRLDKVLYVGLPTATDRAEILRTITKGGTRPKLESEVDLNELAGDTYCSGFSGADLTALVREAAILALREHMQLTSPFQSNQSDCLITAESCVVSRRHFTTALKKVKPSVSQQEQAFYNQMAQQFSLK